MDRWVSYILKLAVLLFFQTHQQFFACILHFLYQVLHNTSLQCLFVFFLSFYLSINYILSIIKALPFKQDGLPLLASLITSLLFGRCVLFVGSNKNLPIANDLWPKYDDNTRNLKRLKSHS